MTRKKTGTKPRKAQASKASQRKAKPKPRKPRRPVAFRIACPSCGVGPDRPCLLLAAPDMGHRKRLEQALSFANGVAQATTAHASRIAAYEASKVKGVRRKPPTATLD